MPSLPSVLIVDDEVRSQESLRRTLEEDFQVFTASGAAEARAILEGQTCEIVLTDQRMPGVSGVEFLRTTGSQDNGVTIQDNGVTI